MKSAVIIFPCSNCDRDMDVALKKYGFINHMIWHDDIDLPKCDLVVLPGGFSYGDYLRCGSIAGKSKIIKSVINFANSGGLVLGICNGFQILTEIGLLEGALIRNKKLKFLGKNCFIKKKFKNNFNLSIKDNQILQIPVAHNEGNFYCDTETLNLLKNNEQIAFEYCKGEFSNTEENINGSIEAIAGITNKKKNVLGMMPHPERAYSDFHQSQDGRLIIESLIS